MLEWVSLSPFFATKATTWIRKSTFVIQISNHLQFPWWKPKQNPHIQACHEYFSVNSASNTVREAQRWCPACISMHWGRGKSLLLDLNLYHTYLSVSVKTPQIWIQIVPKEETWLQLMFQISIVCCKVTALPPQTTEDKGSDLFVSNTACWFMHRSLPTDWKIWSAVLHYGPLMEFKRPVFTSIYFPQGGILAETQSVLVAQRLKDSFSLDLVTIY